MRDKNIQKRYLIPIVVTLLLLFVAVAINLTGIIRTSSLSQFDRISHLYTQILTEKFASLMGLFTERESQLLRHGAKISEYEVIFREYSLSGKIDTERNPLLFSSGIPDKFGLSNPTIEQNLHLLYSDGIILSSSDPFFNGAGFFFSNPRNQERLNRYLESRSPSKSKLFIFENIKNLWFNFYALIPLDEVLEGDYGGNSYIVLTIEHLDIEQVFSIPHSRENVETIYCFDNTGRIFFSFPSDQRKVFMPSRPLQGRLELLKNQEGVKIISNPYRNELGNFVVGASIWLDKLSMGLILEVSAESMMAPYITLIGLILLTVFISFIIFATMVFYLNKKIVMAFDHNALTHLPGNRAIMEKIALSLNKSADHMVIYCDLDNFKAYNDAYGFSAGDDIIHFSSEQLIKHFRTSRKIFLGHIGGDDFIVIGPAEQLKECAEKFGAAFDELIGSYYSDSDRLKGYIESKNRNGEIQHFPFISMSMGGVLLRHYPDCHPLKITEICAEVKKEAKKMKGSTLYIDSRHSC